MMTVHAAAGERRAVVGTVGVTRGYVCPSRDQVFLLPVSMRDWLEDGHLAWFVLDVVAELDTSGLHRRPGGSLGRRPYEPEMLCALVLYSYCCGIRSSRRIEAGCRTDAAFRVICGGLVPDHATIARFVVDQERALEGLFVEGLRLCAAAGLVDLSVVALDGTKIAADASLARNRDGDWIRREVALLMDLTVREEPSSVDGLAGLLGDVDAVGEISSRGGRLARLRAALAVIETEDAAQAASRAAIVAQQTEAVIAAAEHGRKLPGRKRIDPAAAVAQAEVEVGIVQARADARAAARAATVAAAAAAGRTMTGPQPGPDKELRRATARLEQARARAASIPSASSPDRRVNLTDPDSRIMSTKAGWVQGYNAQAIVNQHQIVLTSDVSQHVGDAQLYQPMIARLTATLSTIGITTPVQLALADAGYWSEQNATTPGPDRLIATTKDWKQRKAARELGHTDGPPPPNATPVEQMEHLLRTPQGTAAYAQRSSLIEPVFGDRKHNRGIRSFRRRGLPAARSEWALIHLAGNLLKLREHRAMTALA